MNTTTIPTTSPQATPEVTPRAPQACGSQGTASDTPQSDPAVPCLDTLELIRRPSADDSHESPDPSDTFLTHPRTSIWDLA